jgi:hypothetical protein
LGWNDAFDFDSTARHTISLVLMNPDIRQLFICQNVRSRDGVRVAIYIAEGDSEVFGMRVVHETIHQKEQVKYITYQSIKRCKGV